MKDEQFKVTSPSLTPILQQTPACSVLEDPM